MLEALELDFIDSVFTFLSVPADIFWWLNKIGKTISAFAKYVDMVKFFVERHKSYKGCHALVWHLKIRV